MTKETAEKEYQRKFCEAKLDEYFELIQRDWTSYHGQKVLVRCKECGELFHTWNVTEIFKGEVKRLICPTCGQSSDGGLVWLRSKECDEAMKFYVQGHSVRETAEHFGVTKVQINNAVKARKLTNGRTFRDGSNEHNKKQAKAAEERLEAILESKGFLYCGGYTHKTGRVKITCKTCGSRFTNHIDTVQHGVVICPACERERILARQAEREERLRAESAKRAEERKQLQELERQKAEAEKALALFHLLNDRTHICTVCGKSFSIADYMEDCGLKQIQHNPSYCSHACKRKATNKAKKMSPSGRTGSYYVRARKYGVEYIPGITLKKVVARDGLRCAICGGMCDWNDHTWSSCSGPLHPSIDHIIPMAKGGPHIWENVQVAHVMCNSEKGDKVSV